MFSKCIPNFLLLSSNELILFVISLVFTTAAGVTAFLHFFSESFGILNCWFDDRSLASDQTEIIYSKELETHLGVLERKLIRKARELKASAKAESLEKWTDTQAKVKSYYVNLKKEIKNSEEDFSKIQAKIDGYRKQRVEIEQQMKLNEKYYNNLLRAVPKVGFVEDAVGQQYESKSLVEKAKKCFNLSGRSINVESSKSGTSGPHSLPIFESVKQLKTRFSGPMNLCWCGSISCTGNCVTSKNVKVEILSASKDGARVYGERKT